MKIFIGCALTHVPRELFSDYAGFIHSLATKLEEEAHEVRYALRDSDPQLAEREPRERARLCYVWDRQMVEWSEVMVAEVSFPSTGLGIELQIAEASSTPVLLCHRDWGRNRAEPVTYETPDHERHDLQIGAGFVTLMALGLPNVFEALAYASIDDWLRQLTTAIGRLERSR